MGTRSRMAELENAGDMALRWLEKVDKSNNYSFSGDWPHVHVPFSDQQTMPKLRNIVKSLWVWIDQQHLPFF